MRVLVLTSPGMGHVFPTVPLAWALRAAGHEVLYGATGPGPAIAQAGLPLVDVAPGADVRAQFRHHLNNEREHGALGDRELPWERRRDIVTALFGRVSGLAVDGAVRLARDWRPDLVLHTPLQGAGPLVAGALGLHCLTHGIGLGVSPEMSSALAAAMSADYARQGAMAPERAASVSVAPRALDPDAVATWTMRFVPYNGDGELPEWVLRPADRPRIGVTLGTVSVQTGGMAGLRHVVEAAADTDAEFVFALGEADTSALGALPDNVRMVGWVPLNALLAGCAALVHHGGAGTTLTACAAGLPQIVLPDGADRFRNAEAIRRSGAGLDLRPAELTSATFGALLGDPEPAAAARGIRAEIESLPTPADLVGEITDFVG